MKQEATKLERIDTGDYTKEEYQQFLVDIAFINHYFGDKRALRKSLDLSSNAISVLDVGAGSGELLRTIANEVSSKTGLRLVGLDSNPISAASIHTESTNYDSIYSVQGDAFALPFLDSSFDIVTCSLFTHHLTNNQIVTVLAEMRRVASREVIVIDLHRHRVAYSLYRLMCRTFKISKMVFEDGSLSILRGFTPSELVELGENVGFRDFTVSRSMPYRLILRGTV